MAETRMIRLCGVHKYMYVDLRGLGRPVWRCGKGCGHFLPKNVQYDILGRKSMCWTCGGEFQLSEEDIQTAMQGDGLVRHSECIQADIDKAKFNELSALAHTENRTPEQQARYDELMEWANGN